MQEDLRIVAEIQNAQKNPRSLDLSGFVDRLNIRVLWLLSKGVAQQHQQNGAKKPVRLQSLSLAGWQESDATLLRSLAIIPGESLETVNLSRTRITTRGLAALLTHCHKLAHLNIAGCRDIKSSAMEAVVVAARKTLVSIDFSDCPHMCKDALLWLAGMAGAAGGSGRHCRRLRTLKAANCPRISDPGVAALGVCSRLACLNLEGCSRVTDKGVVALCRSPAATQLLLLDLSLCFQLTDRGLIAIGRHCNRLQSLLLSRCHRISDTGLSAVGAGCPRLQTLYINGCLQVTELGLAKVAQACRNLLFLNVSGCQNITDEGLTSLCKGLKCVVLPVFEFTTLLCNQCQVVSLFSYPLFEHW